VSAVPSGRRRSVRASVYGRVRRAGGGWLRGRLRGWLRASLRGPAEASAKVVAILGPIARPLYPHDVASREESRDARIRFCIPPESLTSRLSLRGTRVLSNRWKGESCHGGGRATRRCFSMFTPRLLYWLPSLNFLFPSLLLPAPNPFATQAFQSVLPNLAFRFFRDPRLIYSDLPLGCSNFI
jgi:hypothetical protein